MFSHTTHLLLNVFGVNKFEDLSKQKYHSLMYRLNELGLYKLGLVNVNVIYDIVYIV